MKKTICLNKKSFRNSIALTSLFICAVNSQASDWSDTSIGFRYGTSFAEPYGVNDIHKNIINFTHASGYGYGTNFFNVDILMSDKKDPASPGSSVGAQETYGVYRTTVDFSKVTGKKDAYAFGPVSGMGVTAGFDWNTKDDAGYNSKKRMLVLGPTLMMKVPGFMNMSLLELWESNAPYSDYSSSGKSRYSYDPHPELDIVWSIPFKAGIPLSFNGYFDYIFDKGKDEFGAKTAAEIHTDMQIMYGVSKSFKVGLEYEYWKNKFGNDASGPAGKGAFAKTPMVRAELHF